MNDHTRALIAAVAYARVSGSTPKSVFDFGRSQFKLLSGECIENVKLFDHDESVHLTGQQQGTELMMFHHERSAHISMSVESDKFKGFDYASSSHYSGRVNGKSIVVFDFEQSQYFNYSC